MNSEVEKTNFEMAWERVKQITGWAKYRELAVFVGSSTESIAGVKKRGKFNLEWARKIASTFESYTDYIMDGVGPKMRGRADHPELTPIQLEDYIVLPVYVTGGAGDPYELIPSDPIEEIFIPRSFYSAAIIPVKVKGRSMERTLRDGAVVGVDRADKDVVNGELYAVWLPYQGTVIKRLYLDNKRILLQSDNEEFRHRDVEVNIADVDDSFIQGRVKWVVQIL